MSEGEIAEYIEGMQSKLEESQQREKELGHALHGQMGLLDGEGNDNLIKFQLDLKEDMDRLYHLLRGDKLGYDEEGNMAYLPQTDPDLIPFSEFGVQLIMNVMSFYLNRNTLLSNYDLKTINWKVYDFGIEMSDLIFNKYEVMMDTLKKGTDPKEVRDHLKEKIKLYPMIIRELVDTVHSAYLRAYNGGERESLRTARTVTQSEPIGSNYSPNRSIAPTQKKTKLWSPSTWGG
tara:strand:- start:1607 stop:2305 length:699 start_codon:yes stop_codon:yes gene_type:complete